MKRRERTRIALGAASRGCRARCAGWHGSSSALMPIRAAEGRSLRAPLTHDLPTRCSGRRRARAGRCSAPRLRERASCPPGFGRRFASSTGSKGRASSRCRRLSPWPGRIRHARRATSSPLASPAGSRLWRTDIGGCIASVPGRVETGSCTSGWSGPAPCGPRQGLARRASSRSASRPARFLWRFQPGNVESSPAIVDDMLFFSAFRNRSESTRVRDDVSARTARIVWSAPIASKVASSPALVGRTLYVSAYDRDVYSFDGWTGRLTLDDDRVLRRTPGMQRPARRAQSRSPRIVVGGRLLRDARRRVRPRRTSASSTVCSRRSTPTRARIAGAGRLGRVDLRVRRRLAREGLRRDDGRHLLRALCARRPRSLGARSGREDPRLRDRDRLAGVRRDDASGRRSSSTRAQARSTGVSPTGTTRRSSSRERGLPRREGQRVRGSRTHLERRRPDRLA